MTSPATRICIDCGQEFPASKDHFRVRRDGNLDPRCTICRASKNRGKKAASKQRDLKAIEAGAANAFTKAASRGGENIPHSSELLESLMNYFGGHTGFAAMMVKQYFDSPAGGAHRTKLLEGIVRLVTKNTELGGAKKPMTQWTDDELEAELDSRLRRLAMNMEGSLLRVQITPETPADFAAAIRQISGRVSEGPTEGVAGGASGASDRSSEALPAD
ncbi:MAG: hypothetical protein EBR88_00305 [Betaproteobacteria bacterium]|nr:hypothetical protein [Betaproteobacteria bacterium]